MMTPDHDALLSAILTCAAVFLVGLAFVLYIVTHF